MSIIIFCNVCTESSLLPLGSLHPTDYAEAILALVGSLTLAVGGVVVVVVTAGTATPAVLGLAFAVSGAGIAGTVNASVGIHNNRLDC